MSAERVSAFEPRGIYIDGEFIATPPKPRVPPCARCAKRGVYSETRMYVEEEVPLCMACARIYYREPKPAEKRRLARERALRRGQAGAP